MAKLYIASYSFLYRDSQVFRDLDTGNYHLLLWERSDKTWSGPYVQEEAACLAAKIWVTDQPNRIDKTP
jgi:hypothetical protein